MNLGNARHPDALWEEGKLLEAMFFWEILEHNNSEFEVFEVASKFPRAQANEAAVGCAGQANLIHRGPRNLQDLKDLLLTYTQVYLLGSRGVHACMGHGCFCTEMF